jgi:hypothetical protein
VKAAIGRALFGWMAAALLFGLIAAALLFAAFAFTWRHSLWAAMIMLGLSLLNLRCWWVASLDPEPYAGPETREVP